jgi:hypothetical protein
MSRRCRFETPAALFVLALLGLGCTSTTDDRGANGGSNGGAGGGATDICANIAPCGGDVVGTWTVTSSCLSVTGRLELGAFFGADCPSAPVTGSLQVSGSWTAQADGTYVDNTNTTGHQQIALPASCLMYSGTLLTCDQVSAAIQAMGYSAATCASAPDGGCACEATLDQTGSAAQLSADPYTSGNFKAASNVITSDGVTSYAYCVGGNKMTWTPQTPSPTTTGSIVFNVAPRPAPAARAARGERPVPTVPVPRVVQAGRLPQAARAVTAARAATAARVAQVELLFFLRDLVTSMQPAALRALLPTAPFAFSRASTPGPSTRFA